jgi:hypothetical protein
MTDPPSTARVLREIDAWFAERGYGLVISEEEGAYWASLLSKRSLQIFWPRYGRGADPVAAAESARQRYIEEQ